MSQCHVWRKRNRPMPFYWSPHVIFKKNVNAFPRNFFNVQLYLWRPIIKGGGGVFGSLESSEKWILDSWPLINLEPWLIPPTTSPSRVGSGVVWDQNQTIQALQRCLNRMSHRATPHILIITTLSFHRTALRFHITALRFHSTAEGRLEVSVSIKA